MSQELSFLSANSNLDPLSIALPAQKKQIMDNASKKTVVLISTHLVPSHPSLNLLQEVIQGYQENLVGLPKDAPVIITVDGIKTHTKKTNIDMVDIIENRKIYQEYLQNLYTKFGLLENVRIVVAGINLGLSKMLKKVIDSHIDTNITKFMYLLQHDLKFTKPINHTALVQLAHDYPKDVNIVNFKRNHNFCENIINANIVEKGSGIRFRKTKRWSDQNQFARISHIVKDVLPEVADENWSVPFPEMRMMNKANKNCEKYGVYEYNGGLYGMYKHLDGSERLGDNLAKRIRAGQIQYSTLSQHTKTDLKMMGVNITQLLSDVRSKGLPL